MTTEKFRVYIHRSVDHFREEEAKQSRFKKLNDNSFRKLKKTLVEYKASRFEDYDDDKVKSFER